MQEQFEMIAKTFMGLEPVLAEELTNLGANDVQIGRRMVSFKGDKEMMYRANFQLHTAIRILKPIARFKARSAEDMYDEVKKIDWSQYIEKGKTFSVDSVVYSEEFRNSRFVTYKVKDAIVDQFREQTGEPRTCRWPIPTSASTSTLPTSMPRCVLTHRVSRCIVAATARRPPRHRSTRCWQQV